MSKKLMIATVGTSIFHSASWDENKDGLDEIMPDFIRYKEMCSKQHLLESPESRKIQYSDVAENMKKILKVNNAVEWAKYVAEYSNTTPLMRYSAEIATLIGFVKIEGVNRGIPWQNIIKEYEIIFLHDHHDNNPSKIAAFHNAEYLKKIIGIDELDSKPVKITNFSSEIPGELVDAVVGLQKFVQLQIKAGKTGYHYKEVVMVVSGGFKIYGLIAWGFLNNPRFKVVYQHEQAEAIFAISKDKISLGNSKPRRITTILD